MVKMTVKINESKCNACCLCVSACLEGAIGLIGGKAKLLNDKYCNEHGRCLTVCPTKAITFEEVLEKKVDDTDTVISNIESRLKSQVNTNYSSAAKNKLSYELVQKQTNYVESHLNQWPLKIKLIPADAPCFNNAHLLVAAECSAFAYANFHYEYMKNKITIIGCTKSNDEDYSEKLADIFKMNEIKSVMVARMETPCCNGIERAVQNALHISGNLNLITRRIVTISTDGKIIE